MRSAWGLLFLLGACTPATRLQRVIATERFALEDTPTGRLAEVSVVDGYRGSEKTPYTPEKLNVEGRRFVEPVNMTSRGTLHLRPLQPVEMGVWVRHSGLGGRGFQRVTAVNGAIERQLPTEVRLLPKRLEEAWSLPFHQLHNVYNDVPLSDGDLVLVELSDGAVVERYLFRTRQLGWRARAGAGVLVQLPIPGNDPAVALSPILALGFSVGYRFRTRRPTVRWLGDKVALIGSVGIGSTAVETAQVDVDELRSLLNAALVGGGVELFDILSIQVFSNLSARFRNASEEPATLAIGFDAVQFGRITRNIGARLFRSNQLDHPVAGANVVDSVSEAPHARTYP